MTKQLITFTEDQPETLYFHDEDTWVKMVEFLGGEAMNLPLMDSHQLLVHWYDRDDDEFKAQWSADSGYGYIKRNKQNDGK